MNFVLERNLFMGKPSLIVSVVFATSARQQVRYVELPIASTVADAIKASGFDVSQDSVVGIFSKVCEWTHVLSGGERIEIYRKLSADPKRIRQLRASLTARSK